MIPEGTALDQPHTNTMERSPPSHLISFSLPAVPQPQGPGCELSLLLTLLIASWCCTAGKPLLPSPFLPLLSLAVP